MWQYLDAGDLNAVIAEIRREEAEVENASDVSEEEGLGVEERREWELDEYASELDFLHILEFGRELATRRQDIGAITASKLPVIYPHVTDFELLQRLLTVFDGVVLPLPYFTPPSGGPDRTDLRDDRVYAAAAWLSPDPKERSDFLQLADAGLVQIIDPSEDEAIVACCHEGYERTVGRLIRGLNDGQALHYVRSLRHEAALRLLECMAVVSCLDTAGVMADAEFRKLASALSASMVPKAASPASGVKLRTVEMKLRLAAGLGIHSLGFDELRAIREKSSRKALIANMEEFLKEAESFVTPKDLIDPRTRNYYVDFQVAQVYALPSVGDQDQVPFEQEDPQGI